jgi:hypothetical protein
MMDNNYINISNVVMPKSLPKINFYKNPGYFEIAAPIFELCNLNCSFCFEEHKDKSIDIERIMAMPEELVAGIKDDIVEYGVDTILLRLWGGELFFDALPDSLFDVYVEFYDKFVELVNKELPHCKVEVTWLSNGVFTKYERVERLLERTNGKIAFSYDPVDRFVNDEQKEQWLNTLNHFKDQVQYISITLTKNTINAYIKNDAVFNRIPGDITVDINYYTANPGWEKHVPSDEDIFNFFKWCIDNKHFNVLAVSNLLKCCVKELKPFVVRYCDCKYAKQYHNGECIKDCSKRASSLPSESFYGEHHSVVVEDNCTEIKNSLGLLKRGCLTCEHYEYCPMMCWVAIIFKGSQITKCPLSEVYKYVKENSDLINTYLEWSEEYDKDSASV